MPPGWDMVCTILWWGPHNKSSITIYWLWKRCCAWRHIRIMINWPPWELVMRTFIQEMLRVQECKLNVDYMRARTKQYGSLSRRECIGINSWSVEPAVRRVGSWPSKQCHTGHSCCVTSWCSLPRPSLCPSWNRSTPTAICNANLLKALVCLCTNCSTLVF